MLSPYIDRNDLLNEYLDPIEFANKTLGVIHSFGYEGDADYAEMLKILTGLSLEELGTISGAELVYLFINGLSENKFVTLVSFFDSLSGYKQ